MLTEISTLQEIKVVKELYESHEFRKWSSRVTFMVKRKEISGTVKSH